MAALFRATSTLKHRARLMTMYAGGLRVAEVTHLRVSDIDPQRMGIRIEQGKGRKDRSVMLSPYLQSVLREGCNAVRPETVLFPSRPGGGPLSRATVYNIVQHASQHARITKHVSPYSLRHAYASHLLQRHETRKNLQLDLFSPDDGHFEYSAVTTNKALSGPALWAFTAGRGPQEKTLAELKGEFALDVVPTNHYGANSAWQQLSILAHNLLRSFQLQTLASAKPRSRKRTYAYTLRSMRTLRFLLIARAGRLTRIGGRQVLRLTWNPATQILYDRVAHALGA